MLAKILSASTIGLHGTSVTVEVDILKRGFPAFKIVGLPHKSVAESRERVRAALHNSGYKVPVAKITINLAPADIPKKGSMFDAPIALGILISAGDLPQQSAEKAMFVGELSLDGTISAIPGALPIALHAKDAGVETLYVPQASQDEVGMIRDMRIVCVGSFSELVNVLLGKAQPRKPNVASPKPPNPKQDPFRGIKGQRVAKRALAIAAAGGHNILIKGPPGTGKTLLARACAQLFPELTEIERFEIAKIASITGGPRIDGLLFGRPFRAPHHTITPAKLLGGGSSLAPGEITKAHRGILFLDEFPELARATLESLREVLESRQIVLSHLRGEIVYPASCLLVAAANPCPCGYHGHPTRACTCTQQNILTYARKLSGPVCDRIDMHISVSDVELEDLSSSANTNATVSADRDDYPALVSQAVLVQRNRFKNGAQRNAHMTNQEIMDMCVMEDAARTLLASAYRRLSMTARSYFKSIKIAQTIADMSGARSITADSIAEALQYRST